MGLILLVLASALVITLIALVVAAYIAQFNTGSHHNTGLDPAEIDIKPDYARCAIRADHPMPPQEGWVNIRLSFYLPNARRPVREFVFDRWSRDSMNGFEDRLVDAGFWRTVAESTRTLPADFTEAQHTVMFTREVVRRQS